MFFVEPDFLTPGNGFFLEESKAELEAQDTAHGVIDPLHLDLALPQQRGGVLEVALAHHFHIHSGAQGLEGRLLLAGAVTMVHHFPDR